MPVPSKIYTQSRILQAFRALGIVASDVPVVLSRTGFITTAIGKSFQVYDTEKLTPVAVSSQVPKKIRALAVHNQTTFCAVGRDIYVFERIRETNILRGHAAPVTQLLAVGDYLFSIGDDRTMHIWTISDLSLVNKIEFDAEFTPSVLLHPSTYLNKVVVGSAQGGLQLWNVRTLKCIYSFKGWGSQVTSMAQSPAVDVVAIGLADGRIFIHNLKFDTTLMNFSQRSEGRVTSLSFRTDDKAPWLASGTSSGDVILWNLETQRLQAKIPLAHDADVASVLFLPSEPVLLTSSGDNSIKLWIFDQLNDAAPARLLKSRQGHKAPPTTIRYYGHDVQKDGMVCQILSASQDRSFRMFHTAREQQSAELSQGPLLKKARQNFGNVKLAPILQLAAIDTREKDWSNVVTCHAGDSAAYVWSVQRKAIGKKVLEQPNHDSNDPLMKATAVSISACGNFAFVGTLGGAIFQYNMQSGEPRGSFPTAVTPAAKLIKSLMMPGASYVEKVDTSLPDKHNGQVTGVVVDGMNRCVISIGLDGKMKFWDFTSHKLIQTIDFNSPVTHLVLHKDAALVAAACDDFVVRLVDISTHKIVRRLRGHTHVLTDICFSPDARWIVTSSSDASLRVWDLPTGACIDWIKFPHAVTSVTMSPTGEFIATTHSSQVGIFLWANRAYFDHVFVDQPPQVPICMGMPVPLSEQDMPLDTVVVQETETEETFVVQAKPETDFQSPISPSSSLVTLSTAPKAMWQSLFQLELIKKRNKPKEAPKAPPQAPFFLPTIRKDDVHPTFQSTVTQETKKPVEEPTPEVEMEGWGQNDDEAWGDEDDEAGAEESNTKASSSRIVKSKGLTSSRSKLATLLSEDTEDEHLGSVQNGNVTVSPSSNRVLAYLQSLSASGVDVELSTLCMGDFDEEGKQSLHLFLDFLLAMVDTRQQFQLIQVYLNRFVKVHEDVLVQDTALLDKLSELHAKQQEAWRHVEQLLDHNLCLVAHLTHMQM